MDFANQWKRNGKQILGHWQRSEKTMKHEGDSDINCNLRIWKSPQRLAKGRVRKQMTSRDHPNYSIVEIGQNTEESWRVQ